MNKIYLLILCVVLFGCNKDEQELLSPSKYSIEKEVQICIDKGGIPIRSVWNSTLKDCIFHD